MVLAGTTCHQSLDQSHFSALAARAPRLEYYVIKCSDDCQKSYLHSGLPCNPHGGETSLAAMAKKTKIALIVVVVFVGALAAALYAFNRSAVGIPAFYAWKATSGRAHGGQYADINGIRIYYETYGTGRPVLVLHGGMGAIEAMHYQISALAASRFVIAPDSRAHGRSSDSSQPLSYELMANDMLKL